MLEDNIDCDEIGYRSFEPEKNKIVRIYKVVKDLKRYVTPFSYSLKDEFQLGTIAGVYRYIQVAGQFVWQFLPGVKDAVADLAAVESTEQGRKEILTARSSLTGAA